VLVACARARDVRGGTSKVVDRDKDIVKYDPVNNTFRCPQAGNADPGPTSMTRSGSSSASNVQSTSEETRGERNEDEAVKSIEGEYFVS